MPIQRKEGIGAVFWVTFILFGLLVLIGLFAWMIRKQKPIPNSPERPNGAVWTEPVRSVRIPLSC